MIIKRASFFFFLQYAFGWKTIEKKKKKTKKNPLSFLIFALQESFPKVPPSTSSSMAVLTASIFFFFLFFCLRPFEVVQVGATPKVLGQLVQNGTPKRLVHLPSLTLSFRWRSLNNRKPESFVALRVLQGRKYFLGFFFCKTNCALGVYASTPQVSEQHGMHLVG